LCARPLDERIMRIHVTEEARHLSFARHYLRSRVPQLGRLRRTALSLGAPIILAVMSRLMLKAFPQLVRTFTVARTVVRSAYHRNPQHREATLRSLSKVRRLCRELGLLNSGPPRWLWRALGIWAEDRDPLPRSCRRG
jgi:P-aminobenzoate N-oxygenase AurF